MNHAKKAGVALVAAIILAACGTSANEPLTAGQIDLDEATHSAGRNDGPSSSGDTTAEFAADAPEYCHTLARLTGENSSEGAPERVFEVFVDLLDDLSEEGPEHLRDEIGGFADDYRSLNEHGFDLLLRDPSELTEAELDIVIDLGSAAERFDGLGDELLLAFRNDCGDDFVDSISGAPEWLPSYGDRGSGSVAGDNFDPSNPDFAGEPFEETIAGPFGTGRFNNTDFVITDVEWSNRPPGQFRDESIPIFEGDVDRRFVYLTIELINNDPNDRVSVTDAHLGLLVDDGKPIAGTEALDSSGVGRYLEPTSTQVRIFGFEVGQVVPVEQLTLRFSNDALPGFIDVSGESAPNPYPLTIDGPAPGEYIGNLIDGCDVPYTWTVNTATVLLDLPAEYDGPGPNINSRAKNGKRWLRLEGVITTGTGVGSCSSAQGVINRDSFRLVIDGRPFEPLGAPNEIIGENASIAVDLFWEIPADATELATKGLGRDDNTFESPFAPPNIPSVRGE